MSVTVARESRRSRKSCESCRERKARFQYRGQGRADQHHTLCFACFRRERDRMRAQGCTSQPALQCDAPHVSLLQGFAPPTPLTDRQVSHRRAMLANIERHRNAARYAGV